MTESMPVSLFRMFVRELDEGDGPEQVNGVEVADIRAVLRELDGAFQAGVEHAKREAREKDIAELRELAEKLRNAPKLDPEPWLYAYTMAGGEEYRVPVPMNNAFMFRPRPEYSQNPEDYE